MLKNAKWIWNSTEYINDEYVDFISEFELEDLSGINMDISVDGMFAIYVNGALSGFGECSDDERHKLYDTFRLDEFVKKGKNQLLITVWHHGETCATYKKEKAGCIFSVTQSGKELVVSDEKVLSRINYNFKNGYCKYITGQVGLSFYYDNTINPDTPFTKSALIDKTMSIEKRGIENLVLGERADSAVTVCDGVVTVDMKQETVGFLELDFTSEQDQEILFSYGEHLDKNGKVTRIMAIRDFSVEFKAKKGQNKFINPLRRLAGRYIQFEIKSPVKINYVGLRAVNYPVTKISRTFENPLHNKIYDVAVYTLQCCMHAHYEDCPWREQALYALDSRNQMLCGYVAFNEFKFARHSLILLSRSYVEDLQVLNLTYPRDSVLPIPFFSLVYVIQVYEYVKHSNDFTLYEQVKPVIEGIMAGFTSRKQENGLIAKLPYPFWNFYEWTNGNDNEMDICRTQSDPYVETFDLILNAMYVYAYRFYDLLNGTKTDLTAQKKAIYDKFYDKDKGLFKNNELGENYSVLGNVMAVLAGVGDKSVMNRVVERRSELVDISLSMNGFFYQALMDTDQGYKNYIVKDIEEKYGYMLKNGATTFWETIGGSADFDGAGSLCHGWSALPVYWLTELVK
ncbi:MAG: hypothetical protein IJV99_00660 [Clostridia bacterium]|nr:hypothetical protein [Clostridia bacterium]